MKTQKSAKATRLVTVGAILSMMAAVVAQAGTAQAATPSIIISEVSPWGSTNGLGYTADWFEVTNTGATAVDITGWKMDDNSNGVPATAEVALNGISTIAAGQSVIFIEVPVTAPVTDPNVTMTNFKNTWFGASVPAGFSIGYYTGSGVGLSTTADAVNLFDASGSRVTGVQFGVSVAVAPFTSFDNTAGAGSATTPLPTIGTQSSLGINGAFKATNDANEIGSPGIYVNGSGPTVPQFPAPGAVGIAVGAAVAGVWLVRRRHITVG